jgi:hypothetical protein
MCIRLRMASRASPSAVVMIYHIDASKLNVDLAFVARSEDKFIRVSNICQVKCTINGTESGVDRIAHVTWVMAVVS